MLGCSSDSRTNPFLARSWFCLEGKNEVREFEQRCLYEPALSCSASSIYFSVCSLQLNTRTWPSVAAAVWEMRQFKRESPKRSCKMMMLMMTVMTMGVWVCTCGGTGREAEGVEGGGEPLTASATCTSVYLERPPYCGEGSWYKKAKKPQDGIFCSINFGFDFSLKTVNFAGFGYSLVFAGDIGCLELFLF